MLTIFMIMNTQMLEQTVKQKEKSRQNKEQSI
jgi:hypothetical protein